MKRISLMIVSVICALLFVEQAGAQTPKAGINAASFLKIGVGARQAGLGSAVTSLTGDATNMFWNPAGIALKDEAYQATFTYNDWIAGLKQNAFAGSYHMSGIGTIGVGVMTFGISGIPADRDVYDDPVLKAQQTDMATGDSYDYQDLLFQVTYSRYIVDRLSLGATVKYISEKIDDQTTGGVAFDIGSIYHIGISGWNIGARISNLGSDIQFYDYKHPIPLTFSMGTSIVPVTMYSTEVMLSADVVKPQDGKQYYYGGMELNYNKMLFLRGGWKFNYSYMGSDFGGIDEGTSKRSPLRTSLEKGSFGGGLRMDVSDYAIGFDYAYTVFSILDNVHRFTVQISSR